MGQQQRTPRVRGLALAGALVWLGGCGGAPTGGGGLLGSGVIDDSGEFRGRAQSAAKYREKLTPDEAYHLLRRAAQAERQQQPGLGAQQRESQSGH